MRKDYGFGTINDCYFCGANATVVNRQSLASCKKCKAKVANEKCPVCTELLDVHMGRTGGFFSCMMCDRTWSKSQLKKFKF